jgi:hypothetical protein
MTKRKWIRFAGEAIAIAVSSLVVSWLFFAPMFWELAGHSSGFPEAFVTVFFSSAQKAKTIGGGIDHIGTIWMFGTVQEILAGEQPTILQGLYAPIGFDLGKNTGFAWGDVWLSLPLIGWLGVPGFYNLHVLLTLALTMSGAALLCRTIGAPLLLSIGLASLSILHPFAIEEIYQGRPTQMHWLFHGVFLASLVRLCEGQEWRWVLLGAAALSGACMTYWFGGAAVGFAGLSAYMLSTALEGSRARKAGAAAALATLAVLLCLFLTWRISGPILAGNGSSLFSQLRTPPQYEVDLGLFTIPVQHFTRVYTWEGAGELLESTGISTALWCVALLGAVVPWEWRRRLPWIAGSVIAAGIPMGPAIIFPQGWSITGYALLQTVFPPLARSTLPHRMMVAPSLLFILVGAMAGAALARRLQGTGWNRAFSLGLGGILLYAGLQNAPSAEDTNSGMFGPDSALLQATQRWSGGIIDVPLVKSQHSYVQTIYHRRKILGGPGLISVRPMQHQRYCQRNSFLKMLEQLAEKGTLRTFKNTALEQLHDDGFGILAVHESMSRSPLDAYRQLAKNDGMLDSRGKVLYLPLPKPDED